MSAGDTDLPAGIAVDTSFGRLLVTEVGGAVARVQWTSTAPGGHCSPLLREAAAQLTAYDRGALTRFDLPLRVGGSPFQIAVCDAMRAIPFGETRTYGDIAAELGSPAQAVGQACGANPIPVIIPCHRVLGAGGRLTGFSGGTGVETKVALLRHEGAGGFLL